MFQLFAFKSMDRNQLLEHMVTIIIWWIQMPTVVLVSMMKNQIGHLMSLVGKMATTHSLSMPLMTIKRWLIRRLSQWRFLTLIQLQASFLPRTNQPFKVNSLWRVKLFDPIETIIRYIRSAWRSMARSQPVELLQVRAWVILMKTPAWAMESLLPLHGALTQQPGPTAPTPLHSQH